MKSFGEGLTLPTVIAVLLLALIMRLAVSFIPSINTPDEIYQYLEQAYRAGQGYGILPWEYSVGLRNPMIAGSLIPFVQLATWIQPGSAFLGARILIAVLSLSAVYSAFLIGRRISPTHAVLVIVVAAAWPMLVYYSSHPTSDTVSLCLMVGAAAIITRTGDLRPRAALSAGLLLGLACVTRMQLLPSAVVLAGGTIWFHKGDRQWRYFALGVAIAYLTSIVFDLAWNQIPLKWMYTNYAINIGQGFAAKVSSQPWHYYLSYYVAEWGAAAIPIGLLALLGSRRYPLLLAVALTHLAVHSLIAHKEIRYALLSEFLILLLAAIGTADVVDRIRAGSANGHRAAIVAALLIWLGFGVSSALAEVNRYRWTAGENRLEITKLAASIPDLCGLALYRTLQFYDFAGYVTLGRDVPAYLFTPTARLSDNDVQPAFLKSTPAFNAIIARPEWRPRLPPAYALVDCRTSRFARPDFTGHGALADEDKPLCLYKRPGTCNPTAAAPFEVNRITAVGNKQEAAD